MARKSVCVLLFWREEEGQTEIVYPYLCSGKKEALARAEKLVREYCRDAYNAADIAESTESYLTELRSAFSSGEGSVCLNDGGDESLVFQWCRRPLPKARG